MFGILEVFETESKKKILSLADLFYGLPKLSLQSTNNNQIIEFSQIFKFFNLLVVIKDFPDNWFGIKKEIETNSTNNLNEKTINLSNSEAFVFEMATKSNVDIILS